MARKTLVGAALPLAILLAATPTVATDHRPPTPTLVVQGRAQAARVYTTCWATGSGGFCADGTPSFGRAIRAQPTRGARIRIPHPAAIEDVDLHGWARNPDPDWEFRRAREFRVRRRALSSDGERTGWLLLFRLPRREGHLYLHLSLEWRHRGDLFGTFHALLRK
ncbi:MAG TPA: hypothetical protein VG709_04840 [Actinomycetota bacterium]|nr:hypothetical protein [Actinomycetota bacterium]